jgi:hypothetical protein
MENLLVDELEINIRLAIVAIDIIKILNPAKHIRETLINEKHFY